MGSISSIRKPPHQKTFGLELECYPTPRTGYTVWREGNRRGFWEATSDGSLGPSGLEWVCQPMPYTMLIKSLNKLHKQLAGWQVDDRCGLHIHVSRGYWSEEREIKFSAFLCTLTKDQIKELFGRYSYDYANPTTFRGDKFRAVNVKHPHTYEFRLWKAGDLAWTLEALRRTKLIVEYRGKWTYEKCLELFTTPDNKDFNSVVNQPPSVRRVRRTTQTVENVQ